MASTVRVRVDINNDAPMQIKRMPEVMDALTKLASQISGTANNMSAGYRTGYYYPDHKSPGIGGTQPHYGSEKAKESTRYGSVASVHPLNYAAMKDNYENNTLLKAGG